MIAIVRRERLLGFEVARAVVEDAVVGHHCETGVEIVIPPRLTELLDDGERVAHGDSSRFMTIGG